MITISNPQSPISNFQFPIINYSLLISDKYLSTFNLHLPINTLFSHFIEANSHAEIPFSTKAHTYISFTNKKLFEIHPLLFLNTAAKNDFFSLSALSRSASSSSSPTNLSEGGSTLSGNCPAMLPLKEI